MLVSPQWHSLTDRYVLVSRLHWQQPSHASIDNEALRCMAWGSVRHAINMSHAVRLVVRALIWGLHRVTEMSRTGTLPQLPFKCPQASNSAHTTFTACTRCQEQTTRESSRNHSIIVLGLVKVLPSFISVTSSRQPDVFRLLRSLSATAAQMAMPASASASSTATVTAIALSAASPATRLCSAASSGRVTAPFTRAALCALMSSAVRGEISRQHEVWATDSSCMPASSTHWRHLCPAASCARVGGPAAPKRAHSCATGGQTTAPPVAWHSVSDCDTMYKVLRGQNLTAQQFLQLAGKVVLRLLHRALEGVGAQAALERRRRRPSSVASPLPPRRHTCCSGQRSASTEL